MDAKREVHSGRNIYLQVIKVKNTGSHTGVRAPRCYRKGGSTLLAKETAATWSEIALIRGLYVESKVSNQENKARMRLSLEWNNSFWPMDWERSLLCQT